MAKYYGCESGYLARMKLKYRISLILILAGALAVAVKIITLDSLRYWWLSAAILILLIFFLLAVKDKLALGAFMVNRGLAGEGAIRKELQGLPDDYFVFEDLMLPGASGNVDFAVVGPTGVYAIEVKSHRGWVRYSNAQLYLNNQSKKFLAQTISEKLSLETFLRKSGVNLEPQAVLVFSSKRALKLRGSKMGDVYVVGRENLLRLLSHNKQFSSASQIQAAIRILAGYYEQNNGQHKR